MQSHHLSCIMPSAQVDMAEKKKTQNKSNKKKESYLK